MHHARPPRWKTLIAFAIIYLVWGSTFYAIRVGIHEVPPLLLAAVVLLSVIVITTRRKTNSIAAGPAAQASASAATSRSAPPQPGIQGFRLSRPKTAEPIGFCRVTETGAIRRRKGGLA